MRQKDGWAVPTRLWLEQEHKDAETQCRARAAGGMGMVLRGFAPLAPLFSSLPGSYKHLGIDTALEGVYLGGNKQHKVALIATSQETLLQRETHAFPMKKKKKAFFFLFPSPPSTCSDKPPLEAPRICYYQLSHV